jgi:hypothetical protein
MAAKAQDEEKFLNTTDEKNEESKDAQAIVEHMKARVKAQQARKRARNVARDKDTLAATHKAAKA